MGMTAGEDGRKGIAKQRRETRSAKADPDQRTLARDQLLPARSSDEPDAAAQQSALALALVHPRRLACPCRRARSIASVTSTSFAARPRHRSARRASAALSTRLASTFATSGGSAAIFLPRTRWRNAAACWRAGRGGACSCPCPAAAALRDRFGMPIAPAVGVKQRRQARAPLRRAAIPPAGPRPAADPVHMPSNHYKVLESFCSASSESLRTHRSARS